MSLSNKRLFVLTQVRRATGNRIAYKPRALLKAVFHSGSRHGLRITGGDALRPCDLMILYGWGGDLQQRAIRRHKRDYVCFDLGYWERAGLMTRKWRVSINGFHSPDRVFLGPTPPRDRVEKEGIEALPVEMPAKIRRVLLIGNAPKSVKVGASGWSASASQEIRTVFPKAQITYRPKPKRSAENRVAYDRLSNYETPIEAELRACDLVVCRHSNVAVDATRLGVPVVCSDGAAASIYPSNLRDWEDQPSQDLRDEFLVRLSYWQWTIPELGKEDFWLWLDRHLT